MKTGKNNKNRIIIHSIYTEKFLKFFSIIFTFIKTF